MRRIALLSTVVGVSLLALGGSAQARIYSLQLHLVRGITAEVCTPPVAASASINVTAPWRNGYPMKLVRTEGFLQYYSGRKTSVEMIALSRRAPICLKGRTELRQATVWMPIWVTEPFAVTPWAGS